MNDKETKVIKYSGKKCDISRRQLYRWLEDEFFREVYYQRLDKIKISSILNC
ncbi:hypothetical protein [Halonatronum saccharophilum]|uniref:hypothetical protein n=1 Tax=Halonatronum saccharophilum TaxID=150060 RepID=UPI0004BC43A7|nr:hypothetical protein [Halonatronum saccharophilum]